MQNVFWWGQSNKLYHCRKADQVHDADDEESHSITFQAEGELTGPLTSVIGPKAQALRAKSHRIATAFDPRAGRERTA